MEASFEKRFIIVRFHQNAKGLGWARDKEAARKVAQESGAKDEDVHSTKRRFAKEATQSIRDALNKAYNFNKRNSIATGEDGERLMPASFISEYETAMATLNENLKRAKAEFLPHYPEWIEEAKQRLKKLFKAQDYPTMEEMRRNFTMSYSLIPIHNPNADFGFSRSVEASIRRGITDEIERMKAAGSLDLLNRMYEAMARMVERLGKADSIFRDSIVGNLKDICEAVKFLNPDGNTDIESIRKKIEDKLSGLDPKDLRDKRKIRLQAFNEAKEISEEIEQARRKILL